MKKKIFAIAAFALLAIAPAMGQIVILDEDEWNGNRAQATVEEFGVMVPQQNIDVDQWKEVPLGEGLLVLAGLAGAYLVGKRRKEDE